MVLTILLRSWSTFAFH